MKLNGFPEFIGYWVQGINPTGILRVQRKRLSGSFRMFIDSRINLKNSTEVIQGRIKDKFGKSTFKGIISPAKVIFVKKYREGHSDMDVEGTKIIYKGTLDPETYHGQRFYTGGYSFIKENFSRRKVEQAGGFLLEEHRPSKTLEYLMRTDY